MAAGTPALGTFCTALLHTRDVAAAGRHYQAVFGWDARTEAAGTSFMLGGQRVAAAVAATPGVEGWVPYVAVEDVEATAALAAQRGGVLLDGADEAPGNPRRLVRDPDGALFGLCARDDTWAVDLMDETGSVWWMEVLSNVPGVLREFYGTVLQWQFTEKPLPPHPSYLVGRRGETPAGGILPIGPDWGTPPRWQLLFHVDDLDRCTRQVVLAGGCVEFGPLEVPSAGLLTSVQDPHGALYVLMEPNPRQAA